MIRHRLRNLALVLVSLLCLAFTGGVVATLIVKPEAFRSAIGGPFALEDTEGRRITEADYRGRFMMLYFGYTYCPDVCPTRLQEMTLALEALEAQAPELAARITPVLVTVDPRRDTREALRAYAAHFHPRLEALRGSEAEVAEVVRSFQGYVNYVSQADGADYLVDHTAYVYLMGPDGAYLTHFTAFDDETEMTARLARLTD